MADDTKRGVIVNRMGAFVAIPITFINDTRITNAGRCLYMLLSSYTSAKADEAIAFPSYETIMARLGWGSKDTVAAALLNLMQHGWVERKRRYSSSSLYTINYAAGPNRPEIGLSPVVRKVDYQKSGKQTTDSPESRPQPEVQKQEVSYPEVERGTRKTSGFSSVYTTHDDPRVSAFLEILAVKHVTATDAEIIQKRVKTDTLDVWRRVLELWAANSYRPSNFAGMFERYEVEVNAKRFPKQNTATKIGDWTPAKGMYPQVPDPTPADRVAGDERAKVQRAERAARKAEPVDVIDYSTITEAPF